jgi:hypothetical protein
MFGSSVGMFVYVMVLWFKNGLLFVVVFVVCIYVGQLYTTV